MEPLREAVDDRTAFLIYVGTPRADASGAAIFVA
jgi:hypothetical protein